MYGLFKIIIIKKHLPIYGSWINLGLARCNVDAPVEWYSTSRKMLSAFRKPTKEIPPFTPVLPERHWSFHVSQFPTRSPQARTPTIFTSVFTWFNPLFRNPLHILPKSMSATKILEYYPMYYEIMDSTPNQELVLIDSYLNSFFTKHVEKKGISTCSTHQNNESEIGLRVGQTLWPNDIGQALLAESANECFAHCRHINIYS